jgi:molecular chaperone DnaJ
VAIGSPNDDYYALLGVDAGASAAEVRGAWRRLAVRWHPDRAGASATFIFQKIQAAYAVLADPLTRAAYDRRMGVRARQSAPAPSAPPPRRAPSVLLPRLSGPLGGLLACGVARRVDAGLIELFLDAEEAAQGGMATIAMQVPVRCPACASAAASAAAAAPATTAPCVRCASKRVVSELFSAWLAVRPGVADGTVLNPSALLPGMVQPVCFRVRLRGAT